jgi:hypothetical protein
MWGGLQGLVEEIKRCEAAGATTAAVCMAYVCIDTMSFLAMAPLEKTEQTRDDFIAWADTYVKAHEDQPYQYRGIDLYAARCAVLHAFSSEAKLHRQNPDVRLFGYHDGGKHMIDDKEGAKLVLIGTASFLNDVVIGLGDFVKACKADKELRERVEARLPNVLQTFPAPK